jgi:cytochrome c oxidase subunit II
VNGGRRAFLGVASGFAAVVAGSIAAAPPARRIEITAKRFEFIPPEISVARGTRLTLVVTAIDFVHGFSMPDFAIRNDLLPGKPAEVTLTPGTPGRFHYLCDNFCGDGHDRMSGILVVT